MLRRVSTRILDGHDPAAIAEAAAVIRAGGLVAFPTETVYGLGANALDNAAVLSIYAAKGRPADNPLIAHIVGRGMLARVAARVNERAEALMNAFWPGGLTLLFPKTNEVAEAVTCGLPTVAAREPRNAIARALIQSAGVPVAAPSANASGRPSPTRAAHVAADLAGLVDIILDGGPCDIGLESAVVDVIHTPRLLRPGAVPRPDIEAVLRVPLNGASLGGAPESPGMKYRHYAPNAPLTLFEGAGAADEIVRRLSDPRGIVVLAADETAAVYAAAGATVIALGRRDDPREAAAALYDALRRADALTPRHIYAEGFPEGGAGEAVMNRLRKAATSTMREGVPL